MTINNIIFDFDGTLGDSKLCSIMATKKAFKEFGLEVPEEEQIEYYMGIPIEESFKKMSNRSFSENEFEQLLAKFRFFYKEYEESYLQIFPGIQEMLEALEQKNIQLFVVSSKHTEVLKRNLNALKISKYFKEVVGSDKVAHYKPHPEGVNYILKVHQISGEETMMVGDAIFDLQMGKAARVKTCGVTWGSHSEKNLRKEEPDFIIQTPQEILNDL